MDRYEAYEKHCDALDEERHYNRFGYYPDENSEDEERCIYCDSTINVMEKKWFDDGEIKTDLICSECYNESPELYID